VVAVNCSLACERLGMPESQIVLAQAAEYVAAAPKSNTAVESIGRAMDTVARTGSLPIPPYLQDAHYGGASKMGRGIGYQYAHLYEDHYSGQQYLPDALKDSSFYEPSENGYEEQIRRRLGQLTGKEKYFKKESLRQREDG
jgi:putative ATPase